MSAHGPGSVAGSVNPQEWARRRAEALAHPPPSRYPATYAEICELADMLRTTDNP